jgi:hypothetical protein
VFNGPVGSFNVFGASGLSKPVVGDASVAELDLSVVTLNSVVGSTLTISLTDTDFGAGSGNTTLTSVIGGTNSNGTTSFQSYLDPDNDEFGMDCTSGSQGPLGGAFDDTATGPCTLSGPFSLTAMATVTGTGIQSFGSSTTAPFSPPECSIGDFVWEDANGNGCQDSDERPIEGVEVKLFENCANPSEIASTTTNADGWYEFTGLDCDKEWRVQFGDAGDIYSYTDHDQQCVAGDPDESDKKDSDCAKNDGFTGCITFPDPENFPNNPTIDCGYVCEGEIGDRVWLDANGTPGCQDPNEPGLEGVTVKLFEVDGCQDVTGETPSQIASTDANGEYLFTELCPGDYRVTFEDPQGRDDTIANLDCDDDTLIGGGGDGSDSDCGTEDECVELTTDNAVDVTIDCGKVPPPDCDLVVDKKCLVEPPVDGLECDKEAGDKVVATTLRYIGPDILDPTTVVFDPDKSPTVTYDLPGGLANGTVLTMGAENGFTIDARDNENELGAKTKISINDVEEVIHTSCSAPYVVGQPAPLDDPKGDPSPNWLVEDFYGKTSGLVEIPDPPVPSDDCTVILGPELACPELKDAGIDLTSITFMYTNEGCAASNNPQGGKASCEPAGSTSGPGAADVTITASDKDGKNAYEINGMASDTVAAGGLFTVTNGGDKFKADSKFTLVGPDGTQVDFFHTSCSKQLEPGDKFGGIEVLALNGQGGGTDVTYFYEVTNLGDPLTEVTLDDDQFGPIAGPFDLATGETQSFEKTVPITETTINIATASGTLADDSICEAEDTVEVTVEEPPEPPEACIKDVTKVAGITFMYTNEGCAGSDNDQSGGKSAATCEPAGSTSGPGDPVVVTASDKDGKNVYDVDPTTVTAGESFTVTNGGDKFKADSKFTLTASDGTEEVDKFHTSCSQPLAVGDQFGSLLVEGLVLVPK